MSDRPVPVEPGDKGASVELMLIRVSART
jgi:hypothetical protein